jgi:aspartyl-tRNA(Asn)/glutamyl-tRNA(Gln) amidotransferase subunit B
VRASETAPLGTRVEIKNVNSIRFVAKAIEHEIARQGEALARGERIVQETRLWDERAGRTVTMRGKEEAHDYRYFPEPDLGGLEVDEAWIREAAEAMPELPRARRARLVALGVPAADADTLVSARELGDYFEKTVAAGAPPKAAANWITGEALRFMKERKVSPEEALSFAISPERLAALIGLAERGEVSMASAKEVFAAMLDTTADPAAIVAEKGLGVLRDTGALESAVAEVVAGNAAQVAAYRGGKTQTFGWFVGQVMKKTGGRADPAAVRAALERALGPAAGP